MECLHYALSLPTSVVITGIDKPEILDQAIEAAKTLKPMNRERWRNCWLRRKKCDGREVRTVQDLIALRLDREASGLAGRGHARRAGAGPAERVTRVRGAAATLSIDPFVRMRRRHLPAQ